LTPYEQSNKTLEHSQEKIENKLENTKQGWYSKVAT